MVPGLQVTVLLDELSQGDVHMELVWVRVLPTDLQLLDCLTTDLVVLLLKKKNRDSPQKRNASGCGVSCRALYS